MENYPNKFSNKQNNLINKCKKNKINIFYLNNKLKNKIDIINDIKKLKIKCIKLHGINIVKKYSELNNSIELINKNFNKLKKKLNEYDNIIANLDILYKNKIFEKEIIYSFNNNNNNKLIKSSKLINYIAEYSNEYI